MNKKYKTEQLWVLKLGQTTALKESGISTPGFTKWKKLPEIYFAKKIGTDIYGVSTFKLISSGLKVTDDHSKTTVGDVFVCEKHHASLALERKMIDRNTILNFERELNKGCNKNKQQEKTK